MTFAKEEKKEEIKITEPEIDIQEIQDQSVTSSEGSSNFNEPFVNPEKKSLNREKSKFANIISVDNESDD